MEIPVKVTPDFSDFDEIVAQRLSQARTLFASTVAPLRPPAEWFSRPEPNGAVPLTFTAAGEVFGHLALWDTCHSGFLNGQFSECVKAPKSTTDYSQFHLGVLETAEGEMVNVGKLTYDTGHAPLTADLRAASSHYDNTGSVGAFVRARDGQHGIWLSGAVRSDLSPEGLRDLRANPPSGDWRALNHSLELVASLAVPVPGFPITRSQLALSASADGGLEVSALILTGPMPGEIEAPEEEALVAASYTRLQRSKRKKLADRMEGMTAAVLSTKRRNDLPRSSFAMPAERKYPIMDRSHAANALARSSGKPEEAMVRRAVCKRYPDMCKS